MARATRLTATSLAGVTLAAYTALQVLGRVAGTTGAERRRRPGDELVDQAAYEMAAVRAAQSRRPARTSSCRGHGLACATSWGA